MSPNDLQATEQLDLILECLQRMDQRDKLRTWGGFFRGIIGLIPIALFVWSAWYFYQNGPQLMQMVAQEAAKQAASYAGNSTSSAQQKAIDLYNQLMNKK